MLTVLAAAKRRPNLSLEAFTDYWLNHHAPLVPSTPGFTRHLRRYVIYPLIGGTGDPAFCVFQMAGLGPMWRQFAFFNLYCPEKFLLAIKQYRKEVSRQMRVMDDHLGRSEYFAGAEYSIADMAIYPWVEMLRSHFA